MRRFVTLVALLLFTLPFGISISGCGKKTTVVYCNGGDSGQIVGQLSTITLTPKLYGISLNQAAIGQITAPTGVDCKGTTVSTSSYTYATTDMTIADVAPTTGRLCGGTWNRNSGAGIADYTTCNSTGKSDVAFVTASAGGVTSNPIPVFVHGVVTSLVLGSPSTDCTNDPATNCSPAAVNSALSTSAVYGCPTSTTYPSNPLIASTGCCTIPPNTVYAVSPITPYTATGCLSQGVTGQLSARAYAGTTDAQTNISCQVGHLTYTPQTSAVVTIDENGVATAQHPGSTVITSTLSLAASSAGFFSTCPPTNIALAFQDSTATDITITPNNTDSITATVTDKNGVSLTGLTLEYVSTTPTTIPAASAGTVTPIFPGQAEITAICQPSTCNPSPYSEIGLYGNGVPLTSNPVTVTTPGTNGTNLYIASTQSRYLVPFDSTTGKLGSPLQLPYVPNSMVIANSGTAIYLGSSTELMTVSATSNTVTAQNTSVPGVVLAVSPDSSTIVISDPVKQLTYLYTSAGAISSTYGGVGTHAAWSPDSQTVYIAAGNQILVHSAYTGWNSITPATAVEDVTATVPAVGAYFAGSTTNAVGYCPVTTLTGTTSPQATTNNFYPTADSLATLTDRLAATNDGLHVIGATASTDSITDLRINLAPTAVSSDPVNGTLTPSGGIVCPASGGPLTFSHAVSTVPLTGVAPTAITGVWPTSNSSYAFVTYSGTGGVLPAYAPVASQSGTATAGTLTNIPLSGTAIAPVGGVVSADNSTFYAGTSGDDLVHVISITGASPLTDTTTIAPVLPCGTSTELTNPCTSGQSYAAPDLLVQKPRSST
jgi:hypothetical protein